MSLGASILSVVSGAILALTGNGGNVDTVGVTLLLVGTLGVVLTILMRDDWYGAVDDEATAGRATPRKVSPSAAPLLPRGSA